MKAKILGLFVLTLAVIGGGSFSLITSITQMKASVQKELSDEMLISIPEDTDVVENISFPSGEDTSIILWEDKIDIGHYDDLMKFTFFYEGHVVKVGDTFIDESTSMENAKKIMDFVYGYVDETIFKPYEIDKSEYEYSIQRQERGNVTYAVFLREKNNGIVCTIGVCLDEGEPILCSFARSGLVDLKGSRRGPIPDEFLECNWSETTEKREGIYAKYLDKSKEVIAMLGLPPIVEEIKDVDNLSYFSVDDMWSTVSFGYVLEDDTYIRVFYNRVNGLWDGFSIWGYYEGDVEK